MAVIPPKTPPAPLSVSAVSARPQRDAGTSSEMWSLHPRGDGSYHGGGYQTTRGQGPI